MTYFSAAPIVTFVGADPNIDGTVIQGEFTPERWAANLGDPHFSITVEWSWPLNTDDYTHCRVVRSVRSPARRAEEGQTMAEYRWDKWPTHDPEVGRPNYTDVQPPTREWVFYTLFFLDTHRVWVYGGAIGEIGPGDFDWTLRLPELLPGSAVANDRGVVHPADQYNTLVTFLQAPGTAMDIAVSMGEAAQFFWDPLRCPPHAVPHVSRSWGYRYDETLGLGRTRDMLNVLKDPMQGSLDVISRLVDAISGNIATTVISNNLMLDINDSSFESGSIFDQSWGPLRKNPMTASDSLTLMAHDASIGSVLTVPNVSLQWYLSIPPGTTRIEAGYYTEYDDNGNVIPDPDNPTAPPIQGKPYPTRIHDVVQRGIPIQGWNVIRLGCYARVSSGTGTITMSVDLYSPSGAFISTLPVLSSRSLTTAWKWVGNGDGGAEYAGATPANRWSVPIPPPPEGKEYGFAIPIIQISPATSSTHVDLIVVDDG